jgi:hypothetical protein
MRRLPLSLALTLAITLGAAVHTYPEAYAQDVVAAAQEQFLKGRDAFKQGDYAGARALFQKSYELHPTPGVLLNLGLCEEQLGLVGSAWQRFQELTEQVPPSDERYRVAKQHASALEPRVPRLRIELAPGAPAGTSVRRDALVVAGKNLGAELPVDPGKHTIVVTAPGREDRSYEITIAEGKRETLTVEPGAETAKSGTGDPPPAGTASSAPTATTTTTVPPPPPPSNGRRTAGFILGGVGVAGLVVGGVTGGLTLAKTSDVEAMCPMPDRCTNEGVAIADSARTFGLVSTISFIAGGAFVGAGVVLVLTSKSGASTETALAPTLLPGGAGLSARGRF